MEFDKKEILEAGRSLEEGAQAGITLAEALEKARKAAKGLASASSKFKRVLADFDQIQRLGEKKKSGSSRKSSKKTTKPEETPLPEQQETNPVQTLEIPEGNAIVDKWLGITDLLEQLSVVGTYLEDFWQTVLVPIGDWINQTLIPTVGDYLGGAFETASTWIGGLSAQTQLSWQGVQLGAQQIFQGLGLTFTGVGEQYGGLVSGFQLGSESISGSTGQMGQQVGGTANNLMTTLTGLQSGWGGVMNNLKGSVSGMSGGVTGSLNGVLSFLQGGFTSGWKSGFGALKEPVKGVVNSIIGFLNRLLSGLTGALNGVINAANRLKFTVPDWVPGIGGKSYGFSLKNVSVPQIPYLAKGAVLPANQPFLAVVGDQKHGTNIEAPLATIQEAVAQVLGDTAAVQADTNRLLARILTAIDGIEVGDETIGRAARRYESRMAVMGGAL